MINTTIKERQMMKRMGYKIKAHYKTKKTGMMINKYFSNTEEIEAFDVDVIKYGMIEKVEFIVSN